LQVISQAKAQHLDFTVPKRSGDGSQGLQGPVGQLTPRYSPQQRLQAASQGYRLWAVHALQQVVDPTQTDFVPGCWIGDNVLCHLEEVKYLQQPSQPGYMGFLLFCGLQRKCPPSVR